MHLFTDGHKYTYNKYGDIIFKSNDNTYLGALYKNLTLNSVLELEFRDNINNTPACISPVNIQPISTARINSINDILYSHKYNKIIKESTKYNSKKSKKYKKNSSKYHKFNKFHKTRELAIRKKRFNIIASIHNQVYDICNYYDETEIDEYYLRECWERSYRYYM